MATTTTLKLPEELKAHIASAAKAEQEVAEYGLVYEADEVFGYLQAKLDGKKTRWPKTRKL